MKANKKFKEADERAVSAVIGVILMVAITVAIAATVYVYVSGMISNSKTDDVVLCGYISDLPEEKNSFDILKIDNKIYIIDGGATSFSDYLLMKYAYQHGCLCSLILTSDWSNDNVWWVSYGSVSLLDCGD